MSDILREPSNRDTAQRTGRSDPELRMSHDSPKGFHERLADALGQAGYSPDTIRRYLGRDD